MRELVRLLVFGGVFSLLLAGCKSVDPMHESEAANELTLERQVGEAMLDAFRKDDPSVFLKYFPKGASKVYGEREYRKERSEITAKYGELVGYRFLTRLEMDTYHPLIWALRFKRTGSKQQDIYYETLFRIIVGKVDGQYTVYVVNFQ